VRDRFEGERIAGERLYVVTILRARGISTA